MDPKIGYRRLKKWVCMPVRAWTLLNRLNMVYVLP